MILLTIMAYALIVLLDQVQTYKNGYKKDFAISSAMGLLSFAAALALAGGATLPSPTQGIEQLVGMLFSP
ncbi:hypothetical protein MJ257_08765 [Paenibacillus timonensis]|uniref:Uncharacterized protein n=2 Tax=Paenibacillus timonensis TaxID=225915 RepID=A0ABW3SBI3_9BACL|nr:hypothetical protein [Paenibacillus sp.]MCH1640197.1 hypothetical protein [Paenibacillus timonensis]MDU2239638.1 hypothetical protein [Paenibacillus sp.]